MGGWAGEPRQLCTLGLHGGLRHGPYCLGTHSPTGRDAGRGWHTEPMACRRQRGTGAGSSAQDAKCSGSAVSCFGSFQIVLIKPPCVGRRLLGLPMCGS